VGGDGGGDRRGGFLTCLGFASRKWDLEVGLSNHPVESLSMGLNMGFFWSFPSKKQKKGA
jgi:hypothetical protein